MKATVSILGALALCAACSQDSSQTSAPVQQAAEPPAMQADEKAREKQQRMAQRMEEQLDLSPEQLQQMQRIQREGGSGRELKAVLTPEQLEQWNALREERKAQREARPDRIAWMTENLSLSSEQVARMEAIRAEGGTGKDMRAVLTSEQKDTLRALRPKSKEAGQSAASEADPNSP